MEFLEEGLNLCEPPSMKTIAKSLHPQKSVIIPLPPHSVPPIAKSVIIPSGKDGAEGRRTKKERDSPTLTVGRSFIYSCRPLIAYD